MRLNKVSVRITVPKFETSQLCPPALLPQHLDVHPGFRHARQLTLPCVNKMPLFNSLSLPCIAGSPLFPTLHTLSSDLEKQHFSSSFYDALLAFSHAFVSSGILFGFMSAVAELKWLYSIQTAQERIAK